MYLTSGFLNSNKYKRYHPLSLSTKSIIHHSQQTARSPKSYAGPVKLPIEATQGSSSDFKGKHFKEV